ncbi:predicted protein [Uncinocarpus reesii 1704]|uniref:Elongin-A n=1 Tax=Uncinocarpus reesii (strain UAMH 1704) TaxID=336963 RepID=C4JEK3_UNCRE|nr:uncharacterized protein UREG_00842 [Uncinocarpus reesii 1704]EEP75995.1 predicted protein [Uncinocarpus reesii 1704]
MARRACVKQAKGILGVGDAPYELVRSILLKVENPKQLHTIETNSPQLREYTGELWIELIKRDIPFWRKVEFPENPESWYDFYCSLREQAAQELELQAERVKEVMDGLNSQKAKHSAKMVSATMLGLPQQKPTSSQKYANYDRQMGGLQPRFVSAPAPGQKGLTAYSNKAPWSFERPKLRAPPKSRKPAIPVFKRNDRLCTPTHQLSKKASVVNRAPISFVEDYKMKQRLAQQNAKIPIRTPAPPRASGISTPGPQKGPVSKTQTKSSSLTFPQASRHTSSPLIKPKPTTSSAGGTQTTSATLPLQATKSKPSSSVVNPTASAAQQSSPPRTVAAPFRRRSPPNPLLIPKKRPTSSSAQMSSSPTLQTAPCRHSTEPGSSSLQGAGNAKRQRIS